MTYYGFDFDHIGKLLTAYVLTIPIGWDREQEGHAVGIRTFPLVAMASCGYLLAVLNPADSAATSRVVQALLPELDSLAGARLCAMERPCTERPLQPASG